MQKNVPNVHTFSAKTSKRGLWTFYYLVDKDIAVPPSTKRPSDESSLSKKFDPKLSLFKCSSQKNLRLEQLSKCLERSSRASQNMCFHARIWSEPRLDPTLKRPHHQPFLTAFWCVYWLNQGVLKFLYWLVGQSVFGCL